MEIVMTERVTGPASYFPSIEKKYGKPVSYWLDLINASPLTKHKAPRGLAQGRLRQSPGCSARSTA